MFENCIMVMNTWLHKFTSIIELYTYKAYLKEHFQNIYFNRTFISMGKIWLNSYIWV